MQAILRDVFDNTAEENPSQYLVQAKAILQNAGMAPQDAHQLCNHVFDMIVTHVSAALPHLVFHDQTRVVCADMMGEWDVMVAEFPPKL